MVEQTSGRFRTVFATIIDEDLPAHLLPRLTCCQERPEMHLDEIYLEEIGAGECHLKGKRKRLLADHFLQEIFHERSNHTGRMTWILAGSHEITELVNAPVTS